MLTQESIVALVSPVMVAGDKDARRARGVDLLAQDLFAFLHGVFFNPGGVYVVTEK